MSTARTSDRTADVVVRRLSAFRKISPETAAVLDDTIRGRIITAMAGQELVCEGDPADRIRMMLSGWAARYKSLEDGRRQIVNLALPGDTCDAQIYLLEWMDHSISALTSVVYAEIERERFESLVAADRVLGEAFWCETLSDAAIQREWTLNLGRRDAFERVAHILCEVIERLRPVGLLDGDSCAFPITQTDLADATGLSVVHVNRTLQELRSSGLIVLRERTLTVHDLDALKDAALFNPDYLHYRVPG
ncbi:Crp/Fnr family transcriptional regulator [Bradyrhizobium sp. SZCCHNR2032]|uniref:Crp/Fnr family transcriptional regulator n=1 Tax=Bradyrhizobium sp. SZCCHNR2032 TaxID=3057384 RepID=UPI002916CDC0|nr:Crp/Fnr family transcriptional regulator [Bradyrhizobium sp. SZCCHNR2032]